jgi:carboxyl-terminal processing protease
MKMVRLLSIVLLLFVLFFLGFQMGARYEWNALQAERDALEDLFTLAGSGATVQVNPEQEVDISLLWGVWRLLSESFIDPEKLTIDEMVYGAVGGMVAAVGDPYTVFMTPEDSQSFEDAMSGTLEGIGAQMDQINGETVVVAPLKGSPAEKAGLLPKDIVLTVNDEDVTGLRLDQVVSKIRGPAGTSVTIGVYREGEDEPVVLTMKRQAIHIPSVEFEIKKAEGGDIALLTINQFGDSTISEAEALLRKFDPASVRGLVLDLRYNGGGYLDGAVELSSMFLQNKTVVTVERRDTEPEVYETRGSPILPDIPMVVLINEGSASASEIVAGALKDHKRATIIGTVSFGKGTVQEVIGLPNGAALRVTTAKWLTPSGHDLGHTGIAPDTVAERTLEQYRKGEDPQLDAAVGVFKK